MPAPVSGETPGRSRNARTEDSAKTPRNLGPDARPARPTRPKIPQPGAGPGLTIEAFAARSTANPKSVATYARLLAGMERRMGAPLALASQRSVLELKAFLRGR